MGRTVELDGTITIDATGNMTVAAQVERYLFSDAVLDALTDEIEKRLQQRHEAKVKAQLETLHEELRRAASVEA